MVTSPIHFDDDAWLAEALSLWEVCAKIWTPECPHRSSSDQEMGSLEFRNSGDNVTFAFEAGACVEDLTNSVEGIWHHASVPLAFLQDLIERGPRRGT